VKKLLAPLVLTVVLVGAAGIAAWQPWASKDREREVEWLEDFDAWAERMDAEDRGVSACMESYGAEVGEPPARLGEAGEIAQSGCGLGDLGWSDVRDAMLADLTDRRTQTAGPARDRELADRARPYAGGDVEALCWTSAHWDELREEWEIVDADELWPIGFADPTRGRIHLAPEVCGPLHRFFGGDYAPSLNEDALDLASALVTLAHEAEHLRSPEASEAAVECVAIQRVRDLVRDAGRGEPYQELMAGLAWDVGYPDMPPEYRTEACRDGSDLDVRPDTAVWP
jgi:hypothetical protein